MDETQTQETPSGVVVEVVPLPSSLRTPETMQWIQSRFKLDSLERLVFSTPDYYEQKGNYLPDVAALAHAALEQLAVWRERAERLWEQMAVANGEGYASDVGCKIAVEALEAIRTEIANVEDEIPSWTARNGVMRRLAVLANEGITTATSTSGALPKGTSRG